MKLKSKEFNNYFFLPKTCGYRFGNKAPSLYVEDVPQNATSLALAVYDSDVIYDNVELTHWLVWNLPVDVGEFSDDNLPSGAVQGTNDMGIVGYSGPMLARETHHINFLIFALNTDLVLDSTSKRGSFDRAVNGNYIDHASLVGIFQFD
jgi:Raf kinase inhibitor-like YbhB/YbcL family protein